MRKYSILFLCLVVTHFLEAKHCVFIAFHPGAKQHLQAMQSACQEEGWECTFIDQKEGLEAADIATRCIGANSVVAEVGDPFCKDILSELAEVDPSVKRIIYYDNPEEYVPGGYSKTYDAIANQKVDAIFFANEHLAKLEKRAPSYGVGYYLLEKVEDINKLQERKSELKQQFFEAHALQGDYENILLYIGGANKVYYDSAFPHFLSILLSLGKDIKMQKTLVILQQHPRSGVEKLVYDDCEKVFKEKGIHLCLSTSPILEVAAFATTTLYYQTSLAPCLALAGIPLIQIGHESYEDCLVKSKMVPFIHTKEQLLSVLSQDQKNNYDPALILKNVGYNANWKKRFVSFLEEIDIKTQIN